ncbi:sensor histidine kinase [Streptomyces cyaneofuscatus]|uniref:histidine kinase n=1 Tax=Streptomyces cyaneofuscatus TaxID=66883 RepID=A0ABZ1ETR1_9ACTN|nr:histidine kinase [Streptomyces cyaneofuscatus]WSB07443.1 histidine kinase [Streptomyces cyaneofuscatus]WSD49024.1 histidine kinase [Streptomyces cyaneofuscatus]
MSTSPTGPLPPADGLLSAARRNLRELAHGLSHASHPSTPLLAHAPKLWQRLLPYVVVLALAATFIPVTITVLTTQYGVPGALAGALGVAQAAPLLMLAHRPLQAWWIIFPADILGALVLLARPADPSDVWPWTPPVIVAYLFLLLALGLRETRRTVIAVWAVTGAAGAVLHLIAPDRSSGSALLLTILGGVVLVIGGAVRERGVAQRRLAEQETISEAERAQRTLLEERTRIARELHDVVAHHMSVITVQADSAPYRISGLPKAAEEEFTAIAAAARESLAEMRRLLSVLRSEGTGGDLAPQPGLDRLQQLVEATVRAGLPAELALSKELSSGRGEVPPAVDLSAYRIVQEALANVVRHAPGARTQVLVAPERGHLLVLIVNGPAATRASPLETSGTGHGLVGMRERVRLTGGTLDTGPLPDGGFRVAARMPLPPAAAPTAPPSAAPATPLPPEDL